jgi:putative membrane protein
MDFATPVQAFLTGFPTFIIQLGMAIAMFAGSLVVYVLMTPHKELQLIRAGNPSASLAFAGVVVGLAIPLGSCLAHAFGAVDLLIWGVLILLIQILAFRFTDMILHELPRRIVEGDVAAAVFLMSIKIGLALILSGAVSDPSLSMFGALLGRPLTGLG